MSRPRPAQEALLAPVERELGLATQDAPDPREARLQVLEAMAARIGGFSIAAYHQLREVQTLEDVDRLAVPALDRLTTAPIPASLALAALATPRRAELAQRRAGAWHTDWRLATWMAEDLTLGGPATRVIDPAAGSGMLLVAAVLRLAPDPAERARLLGDGVHAIDLDGDALRGAALALASLTDDLGAIAALLPRLRQADALLDDPAAPFDIVVGNPPWERLRLTRHEHLASLGAETHYGDAERPAPGLDDARERLSTRVSRLKQRYELQGTADPDLFKLFTELAVRLLAPDGQLAWLLPGGILRSHGTAALRAHLLRRFSDLRWTILDNRARFFGVDTRQKVVLVQAGADPGPLQLRHARGTADGVRSRSWIHLERDALTALRSDLAIPEVRSDREWALFRRMAAAGRVSDWAPSVRREVDMSLQRRAFLPSPGGDALPLIEGRMVHQFRHDAKRYVAGTGRAARWDRSVGPCAPRPQHWIPRSSLSDAALARVDLDRVGFCDITGQTNERGMLAAAIPAGVACGNKVPTVLFGSPITAGAWVAVANSFAFDWALRRMVTTTVNLFLLRDLPWPAVDPTGEVACRLAALARRLGACRHHPDDDPAPPGTWEAAELRATVEVEVAAAWDLDQAAMRLVLDDFPLLDRACPPLPGEERSSITRDLVLLRIGEQWGEPDPVLIERVATARALGAVPFVPSHQGHRR